MGDTTAYVKEGAAADAGDTDDGNPGGRIAVLLATDLVYVGVFFFLFTEIGCGFCPASFIAPAPPLATAVASQWRD